MCSSLFFILPLLFCRHPIPLNSDLTANSKKYQASYSGGKYGFTIDGTFYEIGGGGMPTFDFTNYLHIFSASAPSGIPSGATYGNKYTASSSCYLVGFASADGNQKVQINKTVLQLGNTSYRDSGFINIKLSAGDTVTVAFATESMHILKEK